MKYLIFILLIILAYLIGAFPTGVIIGKKFYHKDIRQFGSGNTGTTNTFRVLGFWPGMIVLIVDILKGTLGASLPMIFHLGPHYLVLVFGLASIVGHAFSIFLGFKGGKAVATSAGVLLAYNPQFFIIACLIFIALLLITSMVSLSSMIAMVIISFVSLLYHDIFLTIIAIIVTIFIIWRHVQNIQRIKSGSENLTPFGINYWRHQKNKD